MRDAEIKVEPHGAPLHRPLVRKTIGALSALALFAGLGISLLEVFGLSVEGPTLGACWALAVALIVFCALMLDRGKKARYAYAALGLAALVGGIVFGQGIVDGGAQALNSLSDIIAFYTGVYRMPYETISENNLTVFLCAASAVLAFIAAQTALRGNIVLSILFSLFVVGAYGFGLVEPSPWILVFAAGIIGSLCMNTSLLNHYRDERTFFYSLALLFLLAGLCIGAVFAVAGGATIDTSAPRKAVEQSLARLLYGGEEYAMPAGNLENLESLTASEHVSLVVDTDAPTKEYLKGFVGEYYTGTVWQRLPEESMKKSRERLLWLQQEGFKTTSQLEDAAEVVSFGERNSHGMSITNTGARGPYSYLPYAYGSGASFSTITSQATTDAEASASSFNMDVGLLRKSYLLQEKIVAEQDGASPELEAYLEKERAYREFVQENYLEVPDGVEGVFDEHFKVSRQLSVEESKAFVLQALAQSLSYEEAAETLNGDEDFVVHLLEKEKEGYSVHYATLATLLMRYYGVPARYVEGYLLDTTQSEGGDGSAEGNSGSGETEKDGGDEAAQGSTGEGSQNGTGAGEAGQGSTDDAAQSTTVELTEKDAHAWVEYYLEGVGWIPFEVTPGYVDEDFYELSDSIDSSANAHSWTIGSAAEDTAWSPQQVEDEQQPSDPLSQFLSRLTSWHMWLWALLGFVLVLFAALLIRSILRRRQLKRFRRKLASDADADALQTLFAYALYLGRECLTCAFENKPYYLQGEYAESKGLCEAEAFERAALINDQARFSSFEPGVEDHNEMTEFVENVIKNIKQGNHFLKKLYWRWVRCLY